MIPTNLNARLDALITRLQDDAAQTRTLDKDAQRARLLTRKREVLIAHRSQLRTQEQRAIQQLTRIDYATIQPVLRYAKPQDYPLWTYYRMIASSAPYTGRPGRMLRLFAVDQVSGSVLGVVELGSDLQNLLPRDQYIQWTRAQKYANSGLQRIANVSSCVGIANFGLLCGVKFLIDALVTTDETSVYRMWKRKYDDTLAMLTITSLYGKSSAYNRLPRVRYLGTTLGQGTAQLTTQDYADLKAFALAHGLTGRAKNRTFLTTSRNDLLDVLCHAYAIPRSRLSIPTPRGVYVAALVENPFDVLRENLDPVEISRSAADAQAYYLTRWHAMRIAQPEIRAQLARFDPDSYRVDAQIDACEDSNGL